MVTLTVVVAHLPFKCRGPLHGVAKVILSAWFFPRKTGWSSGEKRAAACWWRAAGQPRRKKRK